MESDEGFYGVKWFELEHDFKVGVCSFSNKIAFLTTAPLGVLYDVCDSIEISEEEGDLVCEVGSGCYCDSCPYCNISFEDMVETHSADPSPEDYVSQVRETMDKWEEKFHEVEEEQGKFRPGVYSK